MFIYLFISVDKDNCICSSCNVENGVDTLMTSSGARTEVASHAVLSCQQSRSDGLPTRPCAAVKNGSADTHNRSLMAVGRSTSATVLPAGDLLLGPHRSGHSNDR